MPVEPVILETILTGWREVVAGVEAETAAFRELGIQTALAGDKAVTAARKEEVFNQATFTGRRMVYAGTLALVAAGAAVLKLGWNYQSAMQQAQVAMAPVFKNTASLHKELQHLFQVTAFSPFQYKDVTTAFRSLYFGLKYAPGVQNPVETANKTLQSLLDALSAAGKATPSNLQRASIALQHMAYTGRLTGYAVNQLSRDGIPMLPVLNNLLGITGDQLHRIGSLNVPVQQVLDGINKFIETHPGYRMAAFRQATMTLHGAFTTFKDLLSQASASSGAGMFGWVQKFLTTTDKSLFSHLYSGKPVTMTDFFKAVDQGLSPRTHIVWDLLEALKGILEGIKESFTALATAIWIALAPLWLLEKVLGIPGAKYGIGYALQVVGFFMGIYIGLLLLAKGYEYALAIAGIVRTAVTKGLAAAQWLADASLAAYVVTMGIYDAVMESSIWLTIGMALAQYRLIAATVLAGLIMKGQMILMEAWTAVVGLFDLAMIGLQLTIDAVAAAWVALDLVMGPIGWIILAIALVTTLYMRWRWFHDEINSLADFLRKHWVVALIGLGSPFLAATILVIENFNKILSVAQKVYDWFSKHNLLQAAANFILPFGLGNIVGKAFGGGGGGAGGPGGSGGAWYTHPWSYAKYADPGYWLGRGIGAIPGLQSGGHVITGGLAMVGERGPELLALPTGASIRSSAQSLAGAGGFTIKIFPQAIMLDGKQIGVAMATAVTDAEARQ